MSNDNQGYYIYEENMVSEAYGFINTGVICWFNSLMQALLSCSSFNRTLLELNDDDVFKGNKMAKEYINLLDKTLPYLDDNGNNINPKILYNIVSSSSNRILHAMHEELKKTKHPISFIGQSSAHEGFILFLELLKNEKIERLFNNRYKQTIFCKQCNKYVSEKIQHEFDISYYYKKDIRTQEEFCSYLRFRPNDLEKYKCEKCDQITPGSFINYKLCMLREIVVVRFSEEQDVQMKWFPEYLEFDSHNDKKIKYKLVSVINHAGHINMTKCFSKDPRAQKASGSYTSSGHYWSMIYRDGGYIIANDNSISKTTFNPTSTAYMLFYHMIKN